MGPEETLVRLSAPSRGLGPLTLPLALVPASKWLCCHLRLVASGSAWCCWALPGAGLCRCAWPSRALLILLPPELIALAPAWALVRLSQAADKDVIATRTSVVFAAPHCLAGAAVAGQGVGRAVAPELLLSRSPCFPLAELPAPPGSPLVASFCDFLLPCSPERSGPQPCGLCTSCSGGCQLSGGQPGRRRQPCPLGCLCAPLCVASGCWFWGWTGIG